MVSKDFFLDSDVVSIAKDLVGATLIINHQNLKYKTLITETEAYRHFDDSASHSNNGKKTKRNLAMYEEGGRIYMYICYGVHNMLNIVTNKKGKADAVLIRSLEPINHIDEILLNRKHNKLSKQLSAGPGNLTKAYDLNPHLNNKILSKDFIYVEKLDTQLIPIVSTRVGIDNAGKDSKNPWRFYHPSSIFVSKK